MKKMKQMTEKELKKIETLLRNVVERNSSIEDNTEWFDDIRLGNISSDTIINTYDDVISNYTTLLIHCVSIEKYELCALIKEVLQIELDDMLDLIYEIPTTDMDGEENKADLIEEIVFISKLSDQIIEDYINVITR